MISNILGAMKHHQVMLFIYMVVLFFIFIIQFSCSCAALSVKEYDQKKIIKTVSYFFLIFTNEVLPCVLLLNDTLYGQSIIYDQTSAIKQMPKDIIKKKHSLY